MIYHSTEFQALDIVYRNIEKYRYINNLQYIVLSLLPTSTYFVEISKSLCEARLCCTYSMLRVSLQRQLL